MKKTLTIITIAVVFNIYAQNNTKYGSYALKNDTPIFSSGQNNTAYGAYAIEQNTFGSNNTASGVYALQDNYSGNYNTAFGAFALRDNNTGTGNTASGTFALMNNQSGHSNTAYGFKALNTNYSGAENTAFGFEAKASKITAKNQIVIGYQTTGQADNSVTLGNEYVTAVYMGQNSGATIYAAGLRTASNDVLTLSENDATFENNLTVNGDVVVASDARLKTNIVSLGATSAKLLLIDGKTYTLKRNGKQKIGLLAQNIQEVFPELVSVDNNKMLAINYQGLVPVLINALKEQEGKMKEQNCKMKKQDAKILRLERLVEKLIADK
ncbi:MAG: tail fiber domain-containing protein [Polaribacter sp.]|nr:tail fiber domain-containing protein [Polaribacter sp.]